nr:hypothetical protein [Tanacetum cinerariifolium]
MITDNGGNQFRQYAGQNAGNLNGYNTVQNVRNQVAQNLRVQNVGNQNGLIDVQGNGNQNQIGNGNLVTVHDEENAAKEKGCCLSSDTTVDCSEGRGRNPDEIKEVNTNCILMANLQQASSSGTQTDSAPVYDSDGSAEYTELLEPIPEPQQVPQND